MGWEWYCSLEAVKRLYPDIKYNAHKAEYSVVPYSKGPHTLISLMKHFYPTFVPKRGGAFHNAAYDCACLKRIFLEKLMPLDEKVLSTPTWNVDCRNLLSWVPKSGPLQVKILTPVKDVKYFRYYKAFQLCKLCNIEFENAGNDWLQYQTPVELFTCAHLFQYGKLKALQAIKEEERTSGEEPNTNRDIWWLACREIEYMLRKFLEIYSDESILILFSYMCNCNQADFARGIRTEFGTKFFPTLPGEPVSYLPFEFSEEIARIMYEVHGLRTAHDIYVEYFTKPDNDAKRDFMYKIIASLEPHSAARDMFDFDILDKKFTRIRECWVFG